MKRPNEFREPIKAVELVRRIRDAHYERFKDRPIEERLAYYREQARVFEEAMGCSAESKKSAV